MKHCLLSFALLSLAALSASTSGLAAPKKAAATPQKEVLWDWWYVHGAGNSPSREITYIDALSVRTEVDHAAVLSGTYKFDPKKKPPSFVEADGVTIFEDAKNRPARQNGRVRINCETQQMMFLQSFKMHWQLDRFERVPPTRWFDANADLKFKKIAHFLCKPKERNHKNQMMRVDQTSDPLDRTWALAWSDAKKPKFISKKTKEQALADFDKEAARSKAIIEQGEKDFTEKRLKMLRDEKITAMEQRALFGKMRGKASPAMHSWLGATDRALVASWGNPSSSYDASGARFITYTEGYATQMQDQQGNVQPGSRQEFYCDMTFEVRGGIIKDYRSGGNYCGSGSRAKPRGPN
jgi:hypothetical protein